MSSLDDIIGSLLFHLYSEASTLHCRTFHAHCTQFNIALHVCNIHKKFNMNVQTTFQNINKHNKQTYYIKIGHNK